MIDGSSPSLSSKLPSCLLSVVVDEVGVLFVGRPLNVGDTGDKVEDDVGVTDDVDDGIKDDVDGDGDVDVDGDVDSNVVDTVRFYEAY